MVAVNRRRRGFPNDNVAEESGGYREVATNSREVKWRDSVNKSFQGSVLDPTINRTRLRVNSYLGNSKREGSILPDSWRILRWLLFIELLGIHHVKPQEIDQFGGSVDFRLPAILPLAQDCGSHDVVPVLSGNQVRRFQEYRRAVCKRRRFPCRFCR